MNATREARQPDSARITLYVAGDAPSSRRARQVLDELLAASGRVDYRIVDVLAEPARALQAGLIATPTLVVERGGRVQRYVGDLRERTDMLRDMLEPGRRQGTDEAGTGRAD